MALRPAQQRNAVSEGMALGLAMSGQEGLPNDKVAVDIAFAGTGTGGAWGGWSYRDQFSQVSTDLKKGKDGIHVITHADENHAVWSLYWEGSGSRFAIRRRPQWEADPLDFDAIAASIDGDVPAAGWQDLARSFLERLDR